MLNAHLVERVTSLEDKWMFNPNVYVITATENGKMVGGVRVHLHDDKLRLPLVEAVGSDDNSVEAYVKLLAVNGVAEACGQWNANGIRKHGLSNTLIRCAVAICEQLGVKNLLGFAPLHALKIYQTVGYRPVQTVGPKDGFPYPDERYRTKVIKVNPETLDNALDIEANLIPVLRKRKTMIMEEQGPKGKLRVHYDILIENPDRVTIPGKVRGASNS